jgi:hypothetical protein
MSDIAGPNQADAPLTGDGVAATKGAAVAAPAKPKSKGGFWSTTLGGVLAAVFGFGAAQYVPAGWPFAPIASGIEAELAKQSAQVQQIQETLAALPNTEGTAAFDAKMAALESKIADPARIDQLDQKLNALTDLVASIPSNGAEPSPALEAEIRQLRDDLSALRAAGASSVPVEVTKLVNDTKAQLTEVTNQAAKIASDAVQRAAIARLQAAMDSGAPFGTVLEELTLDVPEPLRAAAAAGVPTHAALKESFPAEARLALEASLRADMGATWSDRITNYFKSQTGVRSLTPREGPEPDAVLSRAEAALQAGDLTAALTELQALPEAGQSAIAPWRARVEQRLAAQSATDALLRATDQ